MQKGRYFTTKVHHMGFDEKKKRREEQRLNFEQEGKIYFIQSTNVLALGNESTSKKLETCHGIHQNSIFLYWFFPNLGSDSAFGSMNEISPASSGFSGDSIFAFHKA